MDDHEPVPLSAPAFENRLRGLLFGLAVGESVGRAGGTPPTTGRIRAGVGTQLAVFTADGLIRAQVRAHDKGICHPASVLWHAYTRWAVMQNISAVTATQPWTDHPGIDWPDGWLTRVPALRERRGSAPTTVKALAGRRPGTPEQPVSDSSGAHALIRVLPAAALGAVLSAAVVDSYGGYDDSGDFAHELDEYVMLTHGREASWPIVGLAAVAAESLTTGIDPARALLASRLVQMGTYWGRARDVSHSRPREVGVLTEIAPKATCENTMSGAVYTTNCFPGPDTVMDAVCLAASAPHGSLVAATTGALLGAAHGAEVWPVDLLARHELVWPLDTLARDLARRLVGDPEGTDLTGTAGGWRDRYPGH